MALGSGDDELWSQFDLFAVDQKAGKQFDDADLFQDLDESFDQGSFQGCLQDLDDSFPLGFCEGVDKSSVPDISDHILNINFPEILAAEDHVTSYQGSSGEVDTHDSNSSDPLRHDCMWSGVADVNNDNNTDKGEKDKKSSYNSSIFDTPLQSDFETSDLDDQDLIENNNCQEKKVSLTSHIDSDHCYVSSSSQGASLGDTLGPKLGGHQGRQAVTPDKKHVTSIIIRKDEPRTRLVKTGARFSQSAAKFKFQMKFMRECVDVMPRTASLVRNTTNRNRTHYHKRKAAINNTFCPVKSEQVNIRDSSFLFNV